MKPTLGELIQNKRKLRHMTQEHLAEAVGTSPGFISQIENGTSHPSFETLAALIRVLSIDANEIFSEDVGETSNHQLYEIQQLLRQMDTKQQEYIYEMIRLTHRFLT